MKDLTEKQALDHSENTGNREKQLGQIAILATYTTSARIIGENELRVMLEAYKAVLAAIPTESLHSALNLTIKARIASGNTYPITPLEIATRWNKREVTEESNAVCNECKGLKLRVIRTPGERPITEPCPACTS